jgi:two-component system sensor histidine kinase KdpD
VRVRETVPDSVVEAAAEVELVDLPPSELTERLRQGKVYVPEQIQKARENFFRRGNLIALRQLALRYTAERVDDAMLTYRRAWGVSEPWPVRERLLVGVGPAPSSEQLVRASKRLADRLECEWHAVFVETPEYAAWPEQERHRVWESLRLAADLGAETASVGGTGTATLLEYARRHNVTKLVVGKPRHTPWRDRLLGSRVDQLVRASGGIDVYVITGDSEEALRVGRRRARTGSRGRNMTVAAGAVAACTAVAILLRERMELANLIMLYLLVVVAVAVRLGRAASVLASVLAVAAFDWFCVPPYGTFQVADTQHFPVFAVMLVVALVISGLAARLKGEAQASRAREHRTAALLAASRELVGLDEPARIAEVAVRHVGETFGAQVRVYAPDPFGRLRYPGGGMALDGREEAVARWALEHGQLAGRGTDTLPDAARLWVPLSAGDNPVALMAVDARDPSGFRDPERVQLLETFAGQIAAALERARLTRESRRAEHLAELNRLKSEFIAVAAHELRNPLNSLGIAVELLAEQRAEGERGGRSDALVDAALVDVRRLRELSSDLLDLARLEARKLELVPAPVAPLALIERAVDAGKLRAQERGVHLVREADPALPPVSADATHVQRALDNLLGNALEHVPSGGHVVVSADALQDYVQFSVADDGPGLPIRDQERVFEPFVSGGRKGGAGLGLAITREIVRAHGGDIWVDSGPGPGAVFSFTLPVARGATMVDEQRTEET